VSIRALADMPAAEAFADGFASGFRAASIAAGDSVEAAGCGGMEFALSFVAGEFAVVSFQPFADSRIQKGGARETAEAGFSLEIGFQIARKEPAVDFALHALRCSAFYE